VQLHAVLRFSLAIVLLLALSPAVRAAAPRVETTIQPVHSLVAGVMAGIATPGLLIRGGGSPHAHALRPSEARRLQDADVVFWIGPILETFLSRPLGSLAHRARRVALIDSHGLTRHPLRHGGAWDDNDGHDHGHEKEGGLDAHVWLDPRNAAVMTRTIADTLAAVDPSRAARYRANAANQIARIEQLERRLATALSSLREQPYIVFHDAYQYFEKRFGLRPAGAVTIAPDRPPGARRLSALRAHIRATGARCIFIEPQFTPRTAAIIIEGTKARIAVLDPVGADIAPGADAYFMLMERLGASLADCLGAP
jgi:zinc transport system substrate-binding protein